MTFDGEPPCVGAPYLPRTPRVPSLELDRGTCRATNDLLDRPDCRAKWFRLASYEETLSYGEKIAKLRQAVARRARWKLSGASDDL